MANEFPLTLKLKAKDEAHGELQAFTARLKAMTAPFRQFSKNLEGFGKAAGFPQMVQGFTGVGRSLGNVAGEAVALGQRLGMMAGVAGVALFALVHGAVDAGDALAKNADRAGMSVDAYAQLSFVAGRAGITQDEFTTSIDHFTRSMGEAKAGYGPMIALLDKTDPAFKKQVLGAKNSEESLDLMFRALDRIKDPQKRAAFATEAFGRSGVKMGAMVKDGVGDIAKLRAEYLRIAGSQEEYARQSEILNDAMGDVDAAFQGAKVAIATAFFPAFIQLAGVLKEFLATHREGLAKWAKDTAKAFSDWVSGGGIQRLVEGFQRFIAAVSPIADKLGGWPKMLAGIAAAILGGPLLVAIGGLAASFISLGVAMLTTPVGWFLLAVAAIAGGAALIYKNWEPISAFFKEFFPGLTNTITGVVGGFKILVEWIWKAYQAYHAWEKRKGDMAEINGKERPQSLGDSIGKGLLTSNPLGMAVYGGAKLLGAWNDNRPKTGAGDVAPRGGGAASEPNKLVVEFKNADKGTRVTQESGGPIDLSMGYAMEH